MPDHCLIPSSLPLFPPGCYHKRFFDGGNPTVRKRFESWRISFGASVSIGKRVYFITARRCRLKFGLSFSSFLSFRSRSSSRPSMYVPLPLLIHRELYQFFELVVAISLSLSNELVFFFFNLLLCKGKTLAFQLRFETRDDLPTDVQVVNRTGKVNLSLSLFFYGLNHPIGEQKYFVSETSFFMLIFSVCRLTFYSFVRK